MKPRTVLFFDHTARLGGGEIALLNLATSLDRQRYTPVVVLGAEGKLHSRLTEACIETHLLPLESAIGETRKESLGPASIFSFGKIYECCRYAQKLAGLIRNRHADLLHTNSLKADLIGAMAARISDIPLVWHVRDRIADDYLPTFAAHAFRALCRWIPDHVIANSSATRRTLGVGSEAFSTVVHDGMAAPAITLTEPPQGQPIIGLLGRISPWKGQHIFIRAAHQVRKKFPQARYQIIGAPLFGEHDYEEQLHSLVSELNMQDVLEFTGFQDDVKAVMDRLTLLVHASTTPEPLGQVVFEAMYYGKPVVATNGGGVPEIMIDGQTGLLVPMEDVEGMAAAIGSLLKNPSKARQMGAAGHERIVCEFPITKTARKVEAIYDRLLKGMHA